MAGATCPTPAGPVPLDALAEEMFAISRQLRAAAGLPRQDGEAFVVRPETVASIATALGRLAQAQARADLAYVEGARQATRAAAEAQRQSAVLDVTLSMHREWSIHDSRDNPRGPLLVMRLTDDERPALENLLTAARFRGGLTLGLAESKGGEG